MYPIHLNIYRCNGCYIGSIQNRILVPGLLPIMTLIPMGFASFLGTLRWQNAIWDYLMIIQQLVWYPFFKVYDSQLYKKEQEALAAEAE